MQQLPAWSGSQSGAQRVGPRWLRATAVPLTLILCCPPAVMLLWFTHTQLGGSLARLGRMIAAHGLIDTVRWAWGPRFFGSPTAWWMILVFAALQLALLRLVPGRSVSGPVTPTGHVPVYRDNGLRCYAITLGLFWLCSGPLGLFSPAIIYDRFGELLGALNLLSLVLCLLLYLKGRHAPSTQDHGVSGNFIFDYYWGTELYPRVLGWDIKRVTNCRIGLMGWALIVLSFAAKQSERHGLSDSMVVAVALQLLYISKFFLWEIGYLRSLDIMHDRAGFYICWGCLVWLPCVYTSSTLYLVDHPNRLGPGQSLLILLLGAGAILVNYLADEQRQRVRATGGDTTVWGRPPELITARYTTAQGEERQGLLLASGFWGLARHFHYLPEWMAALLWTLPALFCHLLPYFYVVFLGILLLDRAFRDDNRCRAKYGLEWEEYCRRVPYRVVPGLF